MADITILVLHPNEQHCEEIAEAFRGYDSEMVVESVADLRDAPNRAAELKPTLVVVGVDSANDPALKAIETISSKPGETSIIVVSKEPTRELLVSCMRAGADEFLEFPIQDDDLAEAMGTLSKRKGLGGARPGKVIAVFSPAGGMGVTTLACNLTAGIAEEAGTATAACIIDMNVQFGSVALVMDIREFTHTLADAAHEEDRLDENLMRSMMSEHVSGAAVLPAPLGLEELEGADPWHLRGVVQTCRKIYQHVVLDLPHNLDDFSIMGLEEADETFLICDMVLPTIRHTIRALQTLGDLGCDRDNMKLIVNRHYKSHQISLNEMVKHIGLPVHWLIPYDSQAAITSFNAGRTLRTAHPDSPAAVSIAALARHTAGIAPGAKGRKKGGLLGWLH